MAFFSKLFAKPPEIELQTFDPTDRSVLFSCSKPLAGGLQDLLAMIEGQSIRCKINVESIQAGFYYGYFMEPEKALAYLAIIIPAPRPLEEKRGAKRVERRLRVRSPNLRNYLALSIDLSSSGIKMLTDGPMRPGEEFQAQIEFDDSSMALVEVVIQVVWCRAEESKFLIGARFINLPKSTATRIAFFVQDLSKVEKGVFSDNIRYD